MNIEVPFQELERAIAQATSNNTAKQVKPKSLFEALKDKAVSAATSSVKFSSPSAKQIQVGVGPAKVAFEVSAIKDNDITLRTSGAVDALLKLLPQDKLDGLVQHNGDNSITIALGKYPKTKQVFSLLNLQDISFTNDSVKLKAETK